MGFTLRCLTRTDVKLAKAEGKNVDDLIRELLCDRSEATAEGIAPVAAVEFSEAESEVLATLDRQFTNQPIKVKSPVTKLVKVVKQVVDLALRFD